ARPTFLTASSSTGPPSRWAATSSATRSRKCWWGWRRLGERKGGRVEGWEGGRAEECAEGRAGRGQTVFQHSVLPRVRRETAATVGGPPPAREGRSGAAPGALRTPEVAAVEAEAVRAESLVKDLVPAGFHELVVSGDGQGLAGSEAALRALLRGLKVEDALR